MFSKTWHVEGGWCRVFHERAAQAGLGALPWPQEAQLETSWFPSKQRFGFTWPEWAAVPTVLPCSAECGSSACVPALVWTKRCPQLLPHTQYKCATIVQRIVGTPHADVQDHRLTSWISSATLQLAYDSIYSGSFKSSQKVYKLKPSIWNNIYSDLFCFGANFQGTSHTNTQQPKSLSLLNSAIFSIRSVWLPFGRIRLTWLLLRF